MGKRENVQLAVKSTHKIREKLIFPLVAQPKLNGVRGLIYVKHNSFDEMFNDSKIVIESSEGNVYVLPHISNELEVLFDNFPDLILDGELYIHGEPLNQIIRRLPKTNANGTVSRTSLPQEDLEFHIFDIKNNEEQHFRILRLEVVITEYLQGSKIKIVRHKKVNNLTETEEYLDECIKNDYEGIILRYPNSLYSPGSKKVKVMLKWKKSQDTECEILDIISEGMKNGVYVIKFLLKNDINDETFLCNVGDDDGSTVGNSGKWDNYYKESMFKKRNTLIGKMATVKFYERSGIKDVPFHANVVTIRDYE